MSSEAIVLEMVVINPATVLEAFTNGEALDDAIEQVRSVVECFEHDMSTKAGRDRTRSFAAKIPKVKTALAKMGRDLTVDWKKKAKLVDSSIRAMSEAIDEQRDLARKPLTDWEEAQAKIEAEREAREEAAKVAAQLEVDHEFGLLMNKEMDRDAADAKAEAERIAKEDAAFEKRLQEEREARIAVEAAEKVTRDAQAKAEREKAEVDRKLADAQAELERSEREKVEAATHARLKAEREAQQREDARIDEENRIKADAEKKAANRSHQGRINREVLADMMKAGLDEETGKKLIKLIATRQIVHTKIQY